MALQSSLKLGSDFAVQFYNKPKAIVLLFICKVHDLESSKFPSKTKDYNLTFCLKN